MARYQPGLPIIPVSLQFVGAAKPRPEGFAAHYLCEDSMTRTQRAKSGSHLFYGLSYFLSINELGKL